MDWEGRNYLVFTIDWNYSKKYFNISMLDNVRIELDKLQYSKPKNPQYYPHLWSVPAYGKRLQMAPDPYESDILDEIVNKII